MVFRIGSIGDFLISLPCLHLLRKTYPNDEVALLVNEPVTDREVPAEGVLKGSGLVDQFIKYPIGIRNPRRLNELKTIIQRFAPNTLVYLAPSRRFGSNMRDYVFFRWGCGIPRIVGLPLNPMFMEPRRPATGHILWESEAVRLGRQIASIGGIDFTLRENWGLNLSAAEIAEANHILDSRVYCNGQASRRLVGLSIGTKQNINDWGDDNWETVLRAVGKLQLGTLVLLGATHDRERSEKLAQAWPGAAVNLCGMIAPRISAAVLRRIDLLLCHDSGPMHLAAAAGTRCVAVFSRRNPPGRWFPFGNGHRILYPSSKTGTIRSIPPRQVIAAAVRSLEHGAANRVAA
ncbi:MAG: glycosyltransferase family 9 protein [Xanthobacteraceae bacterium]